MRTTILWIVAIAIGSAVTFWSRSRPATPPLLDAQPCRIVLRIVSRQKPLATDRKVKVLNALAYRLKNSCEISGDSDEIFVDCPAGTNSREIIALATDQADLRIREAQGWGPPLPPSTDLATITRDVNDQWALRLDLSEAGSRELARGPKAEAGLFVNGVLHASQTLQPPAAGAPQELIFTGLGPPESGIHSSEGSGYDPPPAWQRWASCLNSPLPADVSLRQVRVEAQEPGSLHQHPHLK
jgi:hypothetical protein